MMTVEELFLSCKSALETENADFEAKQIIMSALKVGKTQYLLGLSNQVQSSVIDNCLENVNKRNSGIPLYYILGECEFYSLKFKVGSGVLIPRQDTELLVDLALKTLEKTKNPSVLDLCSGSGCVAIAIAKNREDSSVDAVELMDDAYSFLCENIELCNAKNVTAIKGDALNFKPQKNYDLVVCNPPYIAKDEQSSLQKEVLKEPHTALFANDDGLEFYKAICNNFKSHSEFTLLFEIGYLQGEQVIAIMKNNGFENVQKFSDLCLNDRVVMGEK